MLNFKINIKIAIILLILFNNSNAYSLTEQCRNDDKSASSNNRLFIEYWTPLINKLNNGVPELSPEENKWLDSELLIGGSSAETFQRWIEAESSKEMKLRNIKSWANSMAVTLNHWKDTPENWIGLIHYFLRSNTSYDLAELVYIKKLKKEIIPHDWIVFGLDPGIMNQRRMYYADMMIKCNLVISIELGKLSNSDPPILRKK
jgi:hypothetical protein